MSSKPSRAASRAVSGSQPWLHQRGHEIQAFGTVRQFPVALSQEARLYSCQRLNQLLADTQILFALYKKHHWLMRGATFYQLHLLLDKHAGEQLVLIDALAERVQTLGGIAVGDPRLVAEITRVRHIMDRTTGPLPVLFLLDELFHGTNSHDRGVGAEAVLRHLLDAGAIGLVTTHDLSVTQIVERLEERARNVHFADQFLNGEMHFDYRMRPGVVPHSNALALMRADMDEVVQIGRAEGEMTPEQLARWERDLGYATKLCVQAVDRLLPALGAHGIDVDNPVHRAGRDIHAISTHACNWDARGLAYARWAYGLEPESPFA